MTSGYTDRAIAIMEKKTASPPYGLTMGKKTTDMQIYRLVRPVLLFIIYKENFRKNYMPFIRGEF